MSANVPASGTPPPPESITGNWAGDLLRLVQWIGMIARTLIGVLRGKINATTTITLTQSATSTTLTDDRIGPSSHIALVPLTSSATAIDIAPYISARIPGSATISHGSSSANDLNFSVLIIG